jgi:hypothetical protein
MTVLDRVMHINVLLYWPNASYLSVVTVATYFNPLCCYNGHILHTSVLLLWPHTS